MGARELGLLLAARRQELHLTQKEAGERIGISQVQVSNWERGIVTDISVERLEDWARIYKMDRAELARVAGLTLGLNKASGTIAPGNEPGREIGSLDHLARAAAELQEAMRSLPIAVPVADVQDIIKGREIVKEEIIEYVYMPPQYTAMRDRVIAFKVVGDAWAPEIKDGDCVLLERGRLPTAETMVAAAVDGTLYIGRVERRGDGHVTVRGDDRTVIATEDEHILGAVIGVVRVMI